ncbi:hypothetical protein B9Z55_026949 [Caenorhabditis nigoni]|nr:hypothetical protein B9Z55_026949 [Caenorhabditis nigoni]
MILQLLLSMKPRHLESLIIGGCWDPIDIADCKLIFETEQFKNAKYVAFLWQVKFNVEDLLNFRHLRQFQCWMKNDIGPEEILRVRDIVSTFEQIEFCDLILRSTEDIFPMGRFAEALGAEIPIGPLAEGEDWAFNHHYKIPKFRESLEFKLTVKESWCRVNIVRIR